MKFSYDLIKKMVPNLPRLEKAAAEFNLKAFEVEEAKGDMIDIAIPANRWADAASHWGVAREMAAIFDSKLVFRPSIINRPLRPLGLLKVKVEDSALCPRYLAYYFEVPAVGQSPAWMRKILKTCGLKPINAIVDILNYVMLEVGQPLHGFDASKIDGDLVVRRAKNGEKIQTIDNQDFLLTDNDLVIADKKPLAIAGIKGGKNSAIDKRTRVIIVEAANFDPISIYKTSKRLKLTTDASERFSHGQSPELVKVGADRAAVLLREICRAELKDVFDFYPKKPSKKFLRFDLDRLNRLTGLQFKEQTALRILRKLGFKVGPNNLIEVPFWRPDIDIFEDLAEEVVRIYGLSAIKSEPPTVALRPPQDDEIFILKDKIRRSLSSLGFNEVYNYSFSAEENKKAIAVQNPISRDKAFLRTSLLPGLYKNIQDNLRFFEEIRIFEIGKVYFKEGQERWRVGVGIYLKKSEEALRELRGALEEMLSRSGLIDYLFVPEKDQLRLEIDGRVSGFLKAEKGGVFAEVDLENLLESAIGEAEYLPLSPYPSVMRDISFYADANVRLNSILESIEALNLPYLIDVDLIDYYRPSAGSTDRISLTFRFVFQAPDRTLSGEEVNKNTIKIINVLKRKFKIEPR